MFICLYVHTKYRYSKSKNIYLYNNRFIEFYSYLLLLLYLGIYLTFLNFFNQKNIIILINLCNLNHILFF